MRTVSLTLSLPGHQAELLSAETMSVCSEVPSLLEDRESLPLELQCHLFCSLVHSHLACCVDSTESSSRFQAPSGLGLWDKQPRPTLTVGH